MGLLGGDGVVRVPAFGGILVTDGQHVGKLTVYARVPSLNTHNSLCIAFVIESAFREADFFHGVVPLDA